MDLPLLHIRRNMQTEGVLVRSENAFHYTMTHPVSSPTETRMQKYRDYQNRAHFRGLYSTGVFHFRTRSWVLSARGLLSNCCRREYAFNADCFPSRYIVLRT